MSSNHPTSGPLKETLELQSIKFEVIPNLLFGLFYVNFLALSHFFSHFRISVFIKLLFFPLLLVFSFVYILHGYFSINGFLSSKDWNPLRCIHLLKFMGKMKISGKNKILWGKRIDQWFVYLMINVLRFT